MGTIILEKYLKAQFDHCAYHTLNLVLAYTYEVTIIRNCISTVKCVIHFVRQLVLQDGLFKEAAESIGASQSNLISLCETHWSEKR